MKVTRVPAPVVAAPAPSFTIELSHSEASFLRQSLGTSKNIRKGGVTTKLYNALGTAGITAR